MCWYHVVDVTVWWVHYSEISQLLLSDHLQYHAGLLQRHKIKNIKHLFTPYYPPPPTLLQSRCEILTKLTRLIIIEVFMRRSARPVMTDSAEHCPTHLSLLRPPGVAAKWRYREVEGRGRSIISSPAWCCSDNLNLCCIYLMSILL